MNATHQLKDEIARLHAVNSKLLKALEGTLSWLTSYPGDGARKAYDRARAAIDEATQG